MGRTRRLAEAVAKGYAVLSGCFLWLDWLVSTEVEFLSTTSEKLILVSLLVAVSFSVWLENLRTKRQKS